MTARRPIASGRRRRRPGGPRRRRRSGSTVGVSGTSILTIRSTTLMLARQMSARLMAPPCQNGPVASSWARRRSTACRHAVNQFTRQAHRASSSRRAVPVRYSTTRGTISGWVSDTSMEASPRTLARRCGADGSSGTAGCTSSRIARDWVMGSASAASRSINAGIAPSGLIRRNASPRCSPASRSTMRSDAARPLRASATRTR